MTKGGSALVGKLVRVEWTDAWADDEGEPSKWAPDCVVASVGWLRQWGPATVVIAAETGRVQGDRSLTHIPKGMVRSVRTLR